MIEKADLPERIGETNYLPHHGVVRDDKATTKLRIPFDASSKPSQHQPSLNECLYKGPNLNPLLYEILLLFRAYPISLTADIEKAFLQRSVNKCERDYLNFLWFEDPFSENPSIVKNGFARVTFGMNSSPFLLNGTLRKHTLRYKPIDLEFIKKVLQAFFVDDFTGGEFTLTKAIELFNKLKIRFLEGNFNLRKWKTKNKLLREYIQQAEGVSADHQSKNLKPKHLGVIWDEIDKDELLFDFSDVI